jgi:hypothetical protein
MVLYHRQISQRSYLVESKASYTADVESCCLTDKQRSHHVTSDHQLSIRRKQGPYTAEVDRLLPADRQRAISPYHI